MRRMLRLAIVSISLACAVLAASQPEEQPETKNQTAAGPMQLQVIYSPSKRLDLLDLEHRTLAFQMKEQVEERLRLTKRFQEIAAKLGEMDASKKQRRQQRWVADDKAVQQVKTDAEKAEGRLREESSTTQQLEEKVATLTKSLQASEANAQLTSDLADSVKQRSMELQSQLDSLGKDTEQILAVAEKLRNVVHSDARRKRDSMINTVETLADTMVFKVEDLASKITDAEDSVTNVKDAAEKISSSNADTQRNIQEQMTDTSAVVKEADALRADDISTAENIRLMLDDLERLSPAEKIPASANDLI